MMIPRDSTDMRKLCFNSLLERQLSHRRYISDIMLTTLPTFLDLTTCTVRRRGMQDLMV